MTLKVGTRVLRRKWHAGYPLPEFRHGVIVEVYSDSRGVGTGGVDLYAVRWEDSGTVEKGYMANGLEEEPLSVGGLGA